MAAILNDYGGLSLYDFPYFPHTLATIREHDQPGSFMTSSARRRPLWYSSFYWRIAISFVVLATYVAVEATRDLATGAEPGASAPGVVLAAVSLVVMPYLARAKARLAPILGSTAAAADAAQTNLCALLSAVLLVGLTTNWLLGLLWADPLAGLGIAVLAAAEARRAWRAKALDDTCCA